mgnify:FL=1
MDVYTMKVTNTWILLATICVFFSACNSTQGNNRSVKKNTQIKLAPISEEVVNQDWLSVIHCDGHNYWFNTQLDSVGQDLAAKFSLNRNIDSYRRPRLSIPVSEMTGIIEMRSGTFTLNRQEKPSAFTLIQGVFSQSDSVIAARASTAIRPLEGCSNMVMVPATEHQKLHNIFAQINKGKAKLNQQRSAGNNLFGRPAQRYNPGAFNYCTRQTKQWLNTFFTKHDQKIYGWGSEKYVQAMYDNDVFAAHFGQPYYSKPIEFLNKLSRQINATHYCSASKEILQKYRHSLTDFTKPLAKYNEKIIVNSRANAVYKRWLMVMVPAIANDSYIANVAKPVFFYDWIRPFLENAETSALMTIQASTVTLLNAKARKISSGKAISLIDSTIESLVLEVDGLNELADFRYLNQRYVRNLAENERNDIFDKIGRKLNAVALPVIVEDLSRRTSVEHYYSVQNWDKTYALILGYLTPDKVTVISNAAIKQQSIIANTYIQSITRSFANDVYPIKDKTQQLMRCENVVRNAEKKYLRLKNNPDFKKVIATRKNQCAGYLLVLKPEYIFRISKTKTLSSLADLEKYYGEFIDLSSRKAKDINWTIVYRRKILLARYYSALTSRGKSEYQKTGIVDTFAGKYFFSERGRLIQEFPTAVNSKPGAKIWTVLNNSKGFNLQTQFNQKRELDIKCNVDTNDIRKVALKRANQSNPNYVILLKMSGNFYGAYTESTNFFGNKNTKADHVECNYQYQLSLYLPSQNFNSSKQGDRPLFELSNTIKVENVRLSNGYLEKMIAGEIDYLLDVFIPSKLQD